MRKSMIALVGTGLGGCLLTTVLMGHLLSMEPDMRLTGPVAEAFQARFAERSTREAALVLKRPSEAELHASESSATVRVIARIWPKADVEIEAMIEDVADYLWKQDFGDPIQEVQIRWRDARSGQIERRIVGRPGRKRILRLYGAKSSR